MGTPKSAERARSILDHRPDLGADYLDLAGEVLARLGEGDGCLLLGPAQDHVEVDILGPAARSQDHCLAISRSTNADPGGLAAIR